MDRTEAWQMIAGIIQAARMMPAKQRAAKGTLPLTVIGGFLGAGKTTLLNHLLADPGARRLAVLVNDFGRINIDAALVRSRTADTISLTNGCACCSVAGDLTRTLIELAQRDEPPEAIVLEASGLADPRGIAQVALANPALRLDGVVTVVDAETVQERAADDEGRETFLAQLSAADLIVLNKQDLAAPEARALALAWIGREAPERPIIEATQGAVPADIALGLHTAREPRVSLFDRAGHARGFESWCLEADAPLAQERLCAMLDALPPEILRAKGILCLASNPGRKTVYQRVGPRASFTPADPWNDEVPRSSLVLIGRAGALEQETLARQFQGCLAS